MDRSELAEHLGTQPNLIEQHLIELLGDVAEDGANIDDSHPRFESHLAMIGLAHYRWPEMDLQMDLAARATDPTRATNAVERQMIARIFKEM